MYLSNRFWINYFLHYEIYPFTSKLWEAMTQFGKEPMNSKNDFYKNYKELD